jgi:alpha-N-arabinofuranosidase
MVLTPTYWVYRLYTPFQGATLVPVRFDAGVYAHGGQNLPRVDAVAARDASGQLWLALTNIDPDRPAQIVVDVAGAGATVRSATGQVLTGDRVDSVNRFDAPDVVSPKAITAKAQNGRLLFELPPRSVTMVALQTKH